MQHITCVCGDAGVIMYRTYLTMVINDYVTVYIFTIFFIIILECTISTYIKKV